MSTKKEKTYINVGDIIIWNFGWNTKQDIHYVLLIGDGKNKITPNAQGPCTFTYWSSLDRRMKKMDCHLINGRALFSYDSNHYTIQKRKSNQ